MSEREWTIGCLEDDPEQTALLRLWLESAGYRCALFASAGEFRKRLGSEAVDLLLLDWNLPDATGLEVLDWIRHSPNSDLPVLFLTARGEENDIVDALQAGRVSIADIEELDTSALDWAAHVMQERTDEARTAAE